MKSLEELLREPKSSFHLIGVGGSGMSGLAHLLLDRGFQVSGSDLIKNTVIQKLEKRGLRFFQGHAEQNVAEVSAVIFSSAIVSSHVERLSAERLHLPQFRRAGVLAVLMSQKRSVAICGMHGKTTTTAMLAHVLKYVGWEASYYIGAEVPDLGNSAAWNKGEWFIAEVDESDGSLTEYQPDCCVVLNIEAEHLDHFGSLENILRHFADLTQATQDTVFYCQDDLYARDVCDSTSKAVGYGFEESAEVKGINWQVSGKGSEFDVQKDGQNLGRIRLSVVGKQNASNALGVVAVATHLGISFEQIISALECFHGTKRRFETKYAGQFFQVVDDYAHHPTEIGVTLKAARQLEPKRLVAIFQPHRYSRTRLLCHDFGQVFDEADRLWLADIYGAGEVSSEGITGKIIYDAVIERKTDGVFYEPDLKHLQVRVLHDIREGDFVLTMGAGDVFKVADGIAFSLQCYEKLRSLLSSESRVTRNEPLRKHTTFRLGGPAEIWCEPGNEEDLARALRFCRDKNLKVTVVGRGSNLLVKDEGIRGVTIHLGNPFFLKMEIRETELTAGAGVRLKTLVAEARKTGLGGFEFMEGIPGTLGGALRMNAGAMGGWTFERVMSVRYMDFDGNIFCKNREEFEVEYRHVPLLDNKIVLSAVLQGKVMPTEVVTAQLKQFSAKRWESQPAMPSAGCIFKNPRECPAGKLVDELGLKNTRIGDASISEVHGNFIVNHGQATATDVLELIERVKQEARVRRGIDLETEVIVLGGWE